MILVGFEEADHRIPDELLYQFESPRVLQAFLTVIQEMGYRYDPDFRCYYKPVKEDLYDE